MASFKIHILTYTEAFGEPENRVVGILRAKSVFYSKKKLVEDTIRANFRVRPNESVKVERFSSEQFNSLEGYDFEIHFHEKQNAVKETAKVSGFAPDNK